MGLTKLADQLIQVSCLFEFKQGIVSKAVRLEPEKMFLY